MKRFLRAYSTCVIVLAAGVLLGLGIAAVFVALHTWPLATLAVAALLDSAYLAAVHAGEGQS